MSQVARSNKSTVGTADNQQAVNYEVRVRILPDSYKELTENANALPFLPGMTATVDIITKKEQNILTIPVSAVTMRSANEIGSDTSKTNMQENPNDRVEVVFVENKGKISLHKVKCGIQDGNYIHVEEGISEGEKVVSGPYGILSNILKDGMQVEVTSKTEIFKTQ